MILGWQSGRRKTKHINTETSETVALPLPLPLPRRCHNCYSGRLCWNLELPCFATRVEQSPCHPALPHHGPVGYAGVWVCELRVNGRGKRGERRREKGKGRGELSGPGSSSDGWRDPRESCRSVLCLLSAENHYSHIFRWLWMHRQRLPGCSWSTSFPVLPTEVPSNRGRAEGQVAKQCCLLLSTSPQKDLEV